MGDEQVPAVNTSTEAAEANTDIIVKKQKIKVDLDTSIKNLEKKLQQAKALKAQKETAIRFAQKKIERRDADRRKILVGVYVLSKTHGEKLTALYSDMQNYLTRDDDKKLFAVEQLVAPLVAVGVNVGHEIGQAIQGFDHQEQVAQSLADTLPNVSHEQTMASAQAVMDAKQEKPADQAPVCMTTVG